MGFERVVQHGLRPVLGLDDDVGLRERPVDVAALVVTRSTDELTALHCFLGVEDGLEHLPFDLDKVDRCPGLLHVVGGDRGHRLALESRLVGEHVRVTRADRGPHTRSC